MTRDSLLTLFRDLHQQPIAIGDVERIDEAIAWLEDDKNKELLLDHASGNGFYRAWVWVLR